MNCRACGNDNAEGFGFCSSCGSPLQSVPHDPGPPRQAPMTPQLSVLPDAPPPAGPPGPMRPPVSAPSPGNKHLRLLKVALFLVGLGAAAAVLFAAFGPGSPARVGGAGSPEEAVRGLANALNHGDLLAASTLISPSEAPDLAELLTTLQQVADGQGMKGLSPGDGVTPKITLASVSSEELAHNAARVRVELEATVDATADTLGGRLAARLPTRMRTRGDGGTYVIVVRESGKWFLSPMLTVADYFVNRKSYAPGDYGRLDQAPPSAKAKSPSEAVDLLAQSITNRDVSLAATVLSPGESRVMDVFEGAMRDFLSRADPSISLSLYDMRLEPAGNQYALVGGKLDVGDGNSFNTIDIDRGGCIRESNVEGSTCPIAELSKYLTSEITEHRPLLTFTHQGGGYRIGLVSSVFDLANQALTKLDLRLLLYAMNAEYLDEPGSSKLVVGTPLELPLRPAPYTVTTVDLSASTEYAVWVNASDDVRLDIVKDGERIARTQTGNVQTFSTREPGTYTVTVRSSLDCSTRCLVRAENATIALNGVESVTAAFETPLSVSVPTHSATRVTFPTVMGKRYEVSNSPDTFWFTQEYHQTDQDGLIVGDGQPVNLVFPNREDGNIQAEVTIHERDLRPPDPERGFADGFTTVVELSGGSAVVQYFRLSGDQYSISAEPMNGQDIALDGMCDSSCVVDSAGSGGTESISLISNGGTQDSLTVRTVDGSTTGQVRLTFSIGG